MIVVLATIRQETAKLEALCIKKALQRQGYVNIKIQISTLINSHSENPIYIVKVPPEVCLALGWEPNNELNQLLEINQLSLNQLLSQKANFN